MQIGFSVFEIFGGRNIEIIKIFRLKKKRKTWVIRNHVPYFISHRLIEIKSITLLYIKTIL